MPRRWLGGGILAVLMSAVLLTLMARARETSPTKESANNPKPSAASKVQVSDVIIQGNQRMTTEQIKVRLRTRPGKEYHAEMMDEDVRQLYRTGQFSNIKTLVQEDGAGKVKIIFLLRDLPSVIQQAKEPSLSRVGQVFIRGNKEISQASILAHVPLFPGAILKYSDLKESEKNLAKLGVFVVDPAKGIQPTIAVIDAGEDSPFKDILITVKEKPQAKDPGSKP